MEFVQFFPTALVWPPEFAGLLWVGQLRYLCGAWLTNKYGQRFMADHDRDRMELATRDTVARAIASEVIEGRGSPHGGVWMSVAHLGRNQVRAFLEETFPGGAFRTGELEQTGIDLTTDSLEVAPTAHFFNGGVVIDESCRTTIPGLFAAGEVVGGLHGANRIEDNAITEALVFGAIAGDAAAEYANRCDDAPLFEGSPPVRRTSSDPAWCDQTASAIGSRMWLAAGPVRSTATLAETADWLRDVRDDAGRRCAREIESMATLGEVITRSALARPASMGAHYLIDSVAEEDSMGTTFASLDDQIHVERRKSPSLVSRPERALA
jgi:succinate dehydrogenase/fumarate reductase flavoprotein subunit